MEFQRKLPNWSPLAYRFLTQGMETSLLQGLNFMVKIWIKSVDFFGDPLEIDLKVKVVPVLN
jgi:hypothetical protein